MKEYKKYVLGGVFACFMAVALMTPIEKSEAFWPFSKAKKENNANYPGAVANTEEARPKQSITVVSPNGGETLQAGKSYTIKWKSKRISKKAQASIFLEEFSNEGATIATSTKNTGIYKWKVPESFGGPDIFKIIVKIEKIQDESDGMFSIKYTAINTLPKIESVVLRKAEGEGDIKVEDSVLLVAKASDADNDNLFWIIDWGDGTSVAGACKIYPKQNREGWEFEASHIWEEKGTYTVSTVANDCRDGTDKTTTNIIIESR